MCTCVCVFLSVNTVYRAPARISRARVSYCINISSVKFVHFSRSQWFQSPIPSLCPRNLGFPLRVRPTLSRLSPPLGSVYVPVLHLVLSVPPNLFIPTFSTTQRMLPSHLLLLESSIIFHERGETTLASVLITAETPELLQRRRSLVSAGRRLHRHRGWLHGSEGGSGQTVVVHVTRRPRPADPYSRPVHRWRAAWHLTLKS